LFAFFALISIYLFKVRKSLEFKYGVFIKRWRGGREKIDQLIKGKRKLFRKLGNLFVAISLILSLIAFCFLLVYTITLKRGLGLLLPTVKGVKYPRPIIGIPFWYWLIAIFVIIVVHESMHAIFLRVEKVKLKNYVLFSPDNINLDKKDKEKLNKYLEKDPLALIEYWSIDPDYDGEVFRSRWQDYRENTFNDKDPYHVIFESKLRVEKKEKRVVCIKAVDIFGFESIVKEEI